MESIFGQRRIRLGALKDFSQLNKPTTVHLKKVYATLCIAMFAAAAGAYVHFLINLGGLLSLVASVGFMIWLSVTPHSPQTELKRLAMLCAFGGCTGLSLGPLLDQVIQVNPSIVLTAFISTSMIFICFSLSALYAKRRSFLFLGGSLLSGMSIMFWLGIMNLFFGSRLIYDIRLYAGLAIMCGFVLFDTQMIVEKFNMGDKDYIWHSVDLFVDFIQIFIRLLIILTQKEKENKKNKR